MNTHARRSRRSGVVLLAAIAAMVLAPSPAIAEDTIEHEVDFLFDQPSLVVDYGQYWSFSGHAESNVMGWTNGTTGLPLWVGQVPKVPGYAAQFIHSTSLGSSVAGSIHPSLTQAPLNAGSYDVTVVGEGAYPPDHYTLVVKNPAKLTINKAKLAVDFRILADTGNRDGAIVTARLDGPFLNDYVYSVGAPGAPVGPGGTWSYAITDASGKVAMEKTFQTEPGSIDVATSFYWADAVPGESYSGSLTFTPDSATAANFDITQAPKFEYTASPLQRPVPASAVEPSDVAPAAPSGNFSIPFWLLLVAGAIGVGLTVAVLVLTMKFVSARQATDGDVAEPTDGSAAR